jgi:hypothetical protein
MERIVGWTVAQHFHFEMLLLDSEKTVTHCSSLLVARSEYLHWVMVRVCSSFLAHFLWHMWWWFFYCPFLSTHKVLGAVTKVHFLKECSGCVMSVKLTACLCCACAQAHTGASQSLSPHGVLVLPCSKVRWPMVSQSLWGSLMMSFRQITWQCVAIMSRSHLLNWMCSLTSMYQQSEVIYVVVIGGSIFHPWKYSDDGVLCILREVSSPSRWSFFLLEPSRSHAVVWAPP